MTAEIWRRSLATRATAGVQGLLGRGREALLSRSTVQGVRAAFLEWRQLNRSTTRLGNACMLHLGRCGSTVVGDLLDQHPSVDWDGELFERVRRRKLPEMWMTDDPLRMLLLRMRWSTGRYYGFEVKFGQGQHLRSGLLDLPLPALVAKLRDLGVSYFILLERRNYLRHLVSGMTAWIRNRHHLPRHRQPRLTSVHVPVGELAFGGEPVTLLDRFADLDVRYREARRLIRGLDGLHLVYEDDVERDPLRAYGRVCEHVGIERRSPRVTLARTNPFPLSGVLENYREVERELRETRYEWMLEE